MEPRIGLPDTTHRFPQFLPDGNHFLYWGSRDGLSVGSLDNLERRLLPVQAQAGMFMPPDRLLFVVNDALFVRQMDPRTLEVVKGEPRFLLDPVAAGDGGRSGASGPSGGAALSVSAVPGGPVAYRQYTDGVRELTWLNRQGVRTGSLGLPDRYLKRSSPRFSPDGQHVAIIRSSDTVTYNVATGARKLLWAGSLTSVWAPDASNGNQMVYSKGRSLFRDATAPMSSSKEALFESSEDHIAVEDWSPDGAYLLFSTDSLGNIRKDTGSDLFAIPLSGDKKPIPVAVTTDKESNGRFSPNSHWIAYESNDAGGQSEVFIQQFPESHGRRQVSTGGGSMPQWSRDGRELYFLSKDSHLMVVSTAFSANGETLDLGRPAPLFSEPLPDYSSYASPDGQRFLINAPSKFPPILILSNWETRQ